MMDTETRTDPLPESENARHRFHRSALEYRRTKETGGDVQAALRKVLEDAEALLPAGHPPPGARSFPRSLTTLGLLYSLARRAGRADGRAQGLGPGAAAGSLVLGPEALCSPRLGNEQGRGR